MKTLFSRFILFFLRSISWVLSTLLFLFIMLWWLTQTESGQQQILSLASHLSSGQFQAKKLTINGLRSLSLEQAQYHHENVVVKLKQANLTWRPQALFSKSVEIASLTAQGLDVFISKPPERPDDHAPAQLPSLPIPVTLEKFKLESTRIHVNNQTYPIQQLSLQLFAYEKTVQVKSANIKMDGNHVALNGQVGETLTLSWQINAPDLNRLWPDLSGRLTGQGNITGSRDNPMIEGQLSAHTLQYKTFSLEHLTAQINQTNHTFMQLTLNAKGVAAPGVESGRLTVEGAGNLKNHRIKALWRNPDLKLDLQLHGLKNFTRVEQLSITLPQSPLEHWSLAHSSRIERGPAGITLDALCLQNEDSKLCATGSLQFDRQLAASIILNDLPLEIAKPWLPTGTDLSGALQSSCYIKGPFNGLLISCAAHTESAVLALISEEDVVENYAIQPMEIAGRFQSGHLNLEVNTQFEPGGSAHLALQVSKDQTLEGSLNASLSNLGFISGFTPRLKETKGTLLAHAVLRGSLQQPEIEGVLELQNGQAHLPDLGITLNAVAFRGEFADQQIHFTGSVHDPKTLSLQGQANFVDRTLTATVSGDHFQAVNQPNASIWLSPSLQLDATPEIIKTRGTIAVPKARFQITSLPESAVRVSEDVVVAGTEDQAGPSAFTQKLDSKITIKLGDEVSFEGFGFTSRLTGELTIQESEAQQTLAYGELTIEQGAYQAYGQNLKINQGRLIFRGPLDNPALDITAVRETEFATAGIKVSGTLKEPVSNVYSIPQLPEDEALAILLTGKPLSSVSESDQNALIGTIATLGLRKSKGITSKIAQKTGLDTLTVATGNDIEQSALLIGKYLTPKLYIRYAVNLFEQGSKVGMEYKINENWFLEAESGEQSSLDLLYKTER